MNTKVLINRPRALKVMRRQHIDLLIGASAEAAFYLSGFRSLSRWTMRDSRVPVFAMLNAKGTVTLVAPAGEIDRFAGNPTPVDRVVSFDSIAADLGDETRWTRADRRLFELALAKDRPKSLWEALDTAVGAGGKLAVDDLDMVGALQERYGGEVIDARAALREIRLLKSSEEIDRLKRAVRITEKAMMASMRGVREGMTERELAEIFDHLVLRHRGRPLFAVIAFGGCGAHGNHEPGDRRLRRGDVIRWDVGCEYDGYPADIARTAVLGRPSQSQVDEWTAIVAGQRAALSCVAPGVTASAVYEAGVQEARRVGLSGYAPKHIGHGIGIGIYEAPMIAPADDTVLEPGMVFEIELINKIIGRSGMHIEDTVVVTDSGSQTLTSMPHELVSLAA